MNNPTNKVSYTHLTPKKRIELSVLLRTTLKQKDIAKILNRDPSTISRELRRNKTNETKIGYSYKLAAQLTKQRRITANKRFRKIKNNKQLKMYIVSKLMKYWSPEQIAGRWNKDHSIKKGITISHESIYQYIYNNNPRLKKYLRCKKGKYRRRYGTMKREKAREEAKKKRIDTRPEIVEKRERIGDWEGDVVLGRERTIGILTHVERKSGYLLADKLDRILARNVQDKTINRFKNISRDKKYTITYDNGSEFTEHQAMENITGLDIYFAYPYHAWERGTNENTNGLLRQFFPKKSPFVNINQEDIDGIVRLINTRPRKRLNYFTPAEVFSKNCTLDLN